MRTPLTRLPSLDLLRGFVAAARRMSITQAAEDLCLTQSAVSRQIKGLEEHLGVELFRRSHRSIELTTEGERLFRLADPWLEQLGELLDALRTRGSPQPVTVTATIGMTSLWLLPQLGLFQSAHPSIDVRVATSNRVLDLAREGVELALRYCSLAAAPEGAERMFDECVVPVASPGLPLAPRSLADRIASAVLLEYEDVARPWLRWGDWLEASGLGDVRPRAQLRFNQYDQVIFAAVAGQGIALGRLPLIAPMLRDGRLTTLRGMQSPQRPDYSYWLITRDGAHEHARIFADWIRQMASASRAQIASCADAVSASAQRLPG